MNPHERTSRLPKIHSAALCKPCGCATLMHCPGDIVVYPWIRNGQPTTNVLFQQVTYEVISAYISRNGNINTLRTFELVYLSCQFPMLKVMIDYASQLNIPRIFWISSFDALPSTRLVSCTTHILIRADYAHLPLLPACF